MRLRVKHTDMDSEKALRRMSGINGKGEIKMEELIKALRRFDSLETVIAELEAFDKRDDLEVTVDDLAEYLNDEADYANY